MRARQLTVLSVAYPLAPVGPDAVGGAEQVLTTLDTALVAAGHRSVVVACEGSVTAGELVPVPAVPAGQPIESGQQQAAQRRTRERVAEVLAREPVDVVHLHGVDFHHYLPAPGVPVLVTLHLPPAFYPDDVLTPERPDTWLSCVSASQAGAMPQTPALLPPIANGVAVERLGELRPRRRGYALMLARVCPEKGVHLALQASHAAGVSCLVAGEVFPYPAHRDYFEQDVLPLLDRRRRYIGPASFQQKRRLLAAARCLVIPSLVAETSSLVAMEAASCGTPVVAFRRGALPEVVEHGRTGFLVDDAAEMAQAIERCDAIDPAVCRDVARHRFSDRRMAAEYLARYQALAGGAARQAA